MEEQMRKALNPREIAKAHLISLMQAGYPWQKAAAMAGLHISRSTAYRLFQAIQTRGDAAILDGRHGHPAKLRETVLQWLVTTCRANLQMPSSLVGNAGIGLAVLTHQGKDCSTEFDGVTVPSIGQRSFSFALHSLEQAIDRCPMHRDRTAHSCFSN
jgi:hypothetical protein